MTTLAEHLKMMPVDQNVYSFAKLLRSEWLDSYQAPEDKIMSDLMIRKWETSIDLVAVEAATTPTSHQGVQLELFEFIRDQAREEEYPVSEDTVMDACRISAMVPSEIRSDMDVYPMYDGDVYVKACNSRGDRVTVICQDDGKVVHRFKIDNYRVYPSIEEMDENAVKMSFDALGTWGRRE